jgi:hypothetical protein
MAVISLLARKSARRTAVLVLDTGATKQALVDYQNAITKISMYVTGVTNVQLPGLTNPPDQYSAYVNKFSGVKTDVMLWPNSIVPLSQNLPTTIVNFNSIMVMNFGLAQSYLTALIQDPSNPTYRTNLANVLGQLRDNAKSNYATLTGLEGLFTQFSGSLTTDGPILDGLAKQALDFAGADKLQITKIQGTIKDQQATIDTLNTWLSVSEIGIGVSIFIAIVGVVCLFVPGGQAAGIGLIALGVVGVGGSIAGTVILNKQINALNDVIQGERQQISQINQDINLLIQLNTQVQQLVTANDEATKAMKVVQDYWKTLDTELSTLITDLNDSTVKLDASQLQAVQTDLTEANTLWGEVNTFAVALQQIKYVVDNTVHALPANQNAA